jgi:trans-2,3-dihydro-3-hydroxyanthranilate isomerase
MPSLDYIHLDVFTGQRFEGNQLAVFMDARGLDPATMQRIAREMNFSESTFLLPAEREDTDVRMRIFTPGIELPMAGHPTIGSTFALAHTGVLNRERDHFVFGLGVGPTRVELQWSENELAFAWMDQRLPEVRPPLATLEQIARAVGVDPAAHRKTNLPLQEISCGVPYILLPLATRDDVDRASPDLNALRDVRSAFGDAHSAIYLFSTETGGDDVTAYSRMFASGIGIAEDPATGSACGPLGSYLVLNGVVSGAAAQKIISAQGVTMGRPSRIHIAIGHDGPKNITRVQVGGQAVVVAEGKLFL